MGKQSGKRRAVAIGYGHGEGHHAGDEFLIVHAQLLGFGAGDGGEQLLSVGLGIGGEGVNLEFVHHARVLLGRQLCQQQLTTGAGPNRDLHAFGQVNLQRPIRQHAVYVNNVQIVHHRNANGFANFTRQRLQYRLALNAVMAGLPQIQGQLVGALAANHLALQIQLQETRLLQLLQQAVHAGLGDVEHCRQIARADGAWRLGHGFHQLQYAFYTRAFFLFSIHDASCKPTLPIFEVSLQRFCSVNDDFKIRLVEVW